MRASISTFANNSSRFTRPSVSSMSTASTSDGTMMSATELIGRANTLRINRCLGGWPPAVGLIDCESVRSSNPNPMGSRSGGGEAPRRGIHSRVRRDPFVIDGDSPEDASNLDTVILHRHNILSISRYFSVQSISRRTGGFSSESRSGNRDVPRLVTLDDNSWLSATENGICGEHELVHGAARRRPACGRAVTHGHGDRPRDRW